MANEISLSLTASFAKGALGASAALSSGFITMTGTNFSQGSLVTNTSTATAIPLGSIGTPGLLFIKNNDPTATVDFYPTNGGVASAKILAGSAIVVYCLGATPSVKAESGTPMISFLVMEA
jgi:hypothetical protein